MGFGLGSIVKAVASPVAAAINPFTVGTAGLLGGPSGGPAPESMVNGTDPRLAEIRDRQAQQAVDYRKNMGGEREKQYNIAKDQSRQQLARSLAGVNTAANQRGMLYGGAREAGEAGARAGNASELNSNIQNINKSTEAQASGLENQALGQGQAMQNTEQNQLNRQYQIALSRQQDKAGYYGGLMGAAGKIGGMGMAG